MTLPSSPRAIVLRWLERLLIGAGGLCLGLAMLGWGEAAVFQRTLDARLERALGEGAIAPAPSRTAPPQDVAAPDAAAPADARTRPKSPPPLEDGDEEVIGRLLAPRLGLRVVVAEGVSSRTLRRAVGHIPGTALPWEDGNVGLAGHRDTFFWPLRDVQVGDALSLVTPRGRFEYVVVSLDVVGPERADLLRPGDTPTLTLVTCYPFSVMGRAPSRLVVKAERVGPDAL
jgi:sortase A